MQQKYRFNDVTLLITHYNRSESLRRLLDAFDSLDCVFGDIVVSDDGSKPEHFQQVIALQQRFAFKLVTTPINRGLGNNINKGQEAATTDYVLYIQEDFVPKAAFPLYLEKSLAIMRQHSKWDLITFYSYESYPYLIPYDQDFSEKKFHWQPWYKNHLKFYVYGDHPHLRRRTFPDKFGKYPENQNVDKTEMGMALSFIRNNGKALLYNQIYDLLDQNNSAIEPSTASYRQNWKQRDSFVIHLMRRIYLVYKFLKLNWLLVCTKKKSV